ncbi:MAG TPA: hypothetical protein VM056_04080 [Terriglobales bacterium]|nr:hypothetical protein [Terriglobales bacterium]
MDLPGRPGFDSVVFANGHLVIAHQGANTVDIFDPTRRRLVAQVNNVQDPRGIVADEMAGRVYVASAAGKGIVVIDSKTWQVLRTIELKQSPEGIILAGQNGARALAVTNPNHRSISWVPVDATGEATDEASTFELGGRPQELAWDAQRKVLFVTVEDLAEVVTVNPFTTQGDAIMQRTKLAASQPTGLVFEPNSRQLFVAVRYAVLQLDAETGIEISRVPAAAGANTLWLESQGNTLFATAGSGTVQTINIGAGKMTSQDEFVSQVRGNGIAYDPVNKLMFLPGGREGKSKLVILKQFGTVIQPGVVSAQKR